MLTLLIPLITFLLSRERLWLGHLQLVVFMSTTLVTRIFGFLHDGTTLAVGKRVITIVEIVFLILNFDRTCAANRLAQEQRLLPIQRVSRIFLFEKTAGNRLQLPRGLSVRRLPLLFLLHGATRAAACFSEARPLGQGGASEHFEEIAGVLFRLPFPFS